MVGFYTAFFPYSTTPSTISDTALSSILYTSSETTNFAIAGVIPNNINGERLFLQQITHMASRVWLWKYGRFNMYYLLTRPFAEVGFSHAL